MLAAIAALLFSLAPATDVCEPAVRVYRDGHTVGDRCLADVQAAGLTAIPLGDAWAPWPFDGAATTAGVAPPRYRDTYLDLADERFGSDTLAAADRHLELFGVFPGLRVVLAAMDDDARHRCHDAVDDAALEAVRVPLRADVPGGAKARRDDLRRARASLAAAMQRHGFTDPAELVAAVPRHAKTLRAAERAATLTDAIAAVQGHLVCDGLLDAPTGGFDAKTRRGLTVFQRRNWIVARGALDADTRDALLAGSRELDFRLALRALRERVTDATGLLADGSARNAWGTVLGRQLDPSAIRYEGAYAPLANGAADAVSPATEAAARALGWLDFASARAGLRRLLASDRSWAGVALPAPPLTITTDTPIRAVIDRDDRDDRAVLSIVAGVGADEVALVRWPTTVGGRKLEKLASGALVRKDKPSDVGPRVWRDLVAAPVWYAPRTTPDKELVGVRDGKWTVLEDLIGPGYRSAYGLVMLVHHDPVTWGRRTWWLDHGIRTHGSVSYRSILTGDSHGCHRLYNHLALRLATFLLRHRTHVVHGPIDEAYGRRVRARGRTWTLHRDDRGFRYELTPPVAIDVRRGVLERR